MSETEAFQRAKVITEKAYPTAEDRAYMQGFSDGMAVAQEQPTEIDD